MKHFKFAAIISLAWFFASASCVEQKDSNGGDFDQTPTEQEPQAGTLPPVETGKANTNYKPAFEGQTRIAGVKKGYCKRTGEPLGCHCLSRREVSHH